MSIRERRTAAVRSSPRLDNRSGQDWVELLGEVGAFSRALAVDLPGCRQVDIRPGPARTVTGCARHFAAVLHDLRVERGHPVLRDFAARRACRGSRAPRLSFSTVVRAAVLRRRRYSKIDTKIAQQGAWAEPEHLADLDFGQVEQDLGPARRGSES